MRHEMSDAELQDSSNWDYNNPVPYTRNPQQQRAIVSVPFKPAEIQRVTLAAERVNTNLSAFIRSAALEKADAVDVGGMSVTVSGMGSSWAAFEIGGLPMPISPSSEKANTQDSLTFEPLTSGPAR